MRERTHHPTHTLTSTPTLDEVMRNLSRFTDEQRSLAWSPEPPYLSTGAHDCRPGGNCGLDFNYETPRARWIQARHRWLREQQKKIKPSLSHTK
jgi:hypothetical protein